MNTKPLNSNQAAIGLAIGILIFAAAFRVIRAVALPELPNFSPLMAIAFCGGLFLPAGLAIVIPLVALIASDIFLNLNAGLGALGAAELLRYSCYAFAIAAGLWIRQRGAGAGWIAGGVLANAVVFYIVTNTAAWIGNPLYSQSLAGWVQSLTLGIPGFAPTWMFFRNSLISDALFTGLFVTAMHFAALRNRPDRAAAAA